MTIAAACRSLFSFRSNYIFFVMSKKTSHCSLYIFLPCLFFPPLFQSNHISLLEAVSWGILETRQLSLLLNADREERQRPPQRRSRQLFLFSPTRPPDWRLYGRNKAPPGGGCPDEGLDCGQYPIPSPLKKKHGQPTRANFLIKRIQRLLNPPCNSQWMASDIPLLVCILCLLFFLCFIQQR